MITKIAQKQTNQKNQKNQFIIFLLIIIIIGCGTEPSKQIIFKAEKSLHQAEQLFNTASIKPDLSDIETWSNVKGSYLSAISFCFSHLDSLPLATFPSERADLETVAFMATSRLASIYFAESKFDSSVTVLSQLLSLTKLSGRALLSSQSNLARAYHASGDWIGGIDIYKSMIATFYPPIDDKNNIIGEILNLPLELHKINIRLQNVPNNYEASVSTRNYYEKLISDWPHTDLEIEARRILAGLLADLSRWDEAIETIEAAKDSTGLTRIPEAMKIAEYMSSGKNDHLGALEIYENILERTDDTALVANLLINIAVTNFRNESYSECLKTLNSVKDDYLGYYMSAALPQQYYALSFERLNEWNRAEDEYQWLITNFPNTELAFEAYLTIAGHYDDINNNELTNLWYKKANEFYIKMQAEFRGTSSEASAISYQAEVARRQGNWEIAAQQLEKLFGRFPNKEVGQKALINAIEIYRDKLNNTAKADSLRQIISSGS